MADIWSAGGSTTPAAAKTLSAAFKQQFHDSYLLALQKTESVLSPLVTQRGQVQGSSFTINDLGTVEMRERDATGASRFSETKFDIPEVGTRMVMLQDYDLYVPIEPTDVYRLTAQLDGPYMQLMVAAANRAKDTLIHKALLGGILRKQDNTLDNYMKGTGYTNVAFDTTNQQILSAGAGATTIASGQPGAGAVNGAGTLDKKGLIAMRALFRRNRADKETIYMLYNAAMMNSILNDSTLTSADFMAVQMLQSGDVASNWLGFQWVPYEELNQTKGDGTISTTPADNVCTQAVAFTKSALQFGTGQNYTTDIGTRHDLRLVKQLSAQMSFGAGRTNEAKVATLICKN